MTALAVESVEAHTCLIIPHFNNSVIVARNKMRLLLVFRKIKTVDACFVATESVVCSCLLGSESPNFNSFVKRSRGKHGSVFGIDCELHDVVLMILETINFCKVFLPVEHLDCVVIRT